MPRTPDQLDLALLKVEAKISRSDAQYVELGAKVQALEKAIAGGPTLAQSLAKIVELLEPLSAHAKSILKTQAGSMGVDNE